jgi:hypothetical protein
MSYIIPTNELSLTDMRAFRAAAIEAGINRALALGVARTREELIVRAALPSTDFGGAAIGWTLEVYQGPAIAAAGWGSVFNAGAVPLFAPTLANSKVAVFYKFADYDAAPAITGLRFRVGGTGATTRASFFLQLEVNSKLEPDVYFTEPVVYDPQDVVYIEAYYNAVLAAGDEQFAFGAFIVERAGATVS